MTKIKDICNLLENAAPKLYAEPYDNVGLLTGDFDYEIDKVLIALDISEDVLNEAIEKGVKLIITHHPVIFSPLKKITKHNFTERLLITAIKHDISIFAAHTNLDNFANGLNFVLANLLEIENVSFLSPANNKIFKISVFVPNEYKEPLLRSLFDAGAGHIGNYDLCSFSSDGIGSFRANGNANPFVGNINEIHFEKENKIEVIAPQHLLNNIISALKKHHPYEEPAFDVVSLENNISLSGNGIIGDLPSPLAERDFLFLVKNKLNTQMLRHSRFHGSKIQKVAVCSGAGGFLVQEAINNKADAFVTADIKYHDFFVQGSNMLLVDAGHYETEIISTQWFLNTIKKQYPDFNVHISNTAINPVNYYM